MAIGSTDRAAFSERVLREGATIGIGPFSLSLRSDVAQIADLVHQLYADFPILGEDDFIDYRVSVMRPRSVRRWIRPYAEFSTDGDHPFSPMPVENAFPLLEWGFNWCVATTAHQFLMLHAGVIERNGVTVLMPAMPGSGKSTLCAALINRGWRLLSDEFALIRPGSVEVTPFPRCIPLKNESIPVIRAFAPDAILGPTFFGTRKGDVAHLRPPRESALRAKERASVTHVIFPQFASGRPVKFTPIPKARAFMKVASNSFNYELFGADGFHTVGDIIERSECVAVEYGELDEAVSAFDALRPGMW
jgi:hypothetical protein